MSAPARLREPLEHRAAQVAQGRAHHRGRRVDGVRARQERQDARVGVDRGDRQGVGIGGRPKAVLVDGDAPVFRVAGGVLEARVDHDRAVDGVAPRVDAAGTPKRHRREFGELVPAEAVVVVDKLAHDLHPVRHHVGTLLRERTRAGCEADAHALHIRARWPRVAGPPPRVGPLRPGEAGDEAAARDVVEQQIERCPAVELVREELGQCRSEVPAAAAADQLL